jgi:1-aminocyclopropane-1-carboxylate deaminase/D-cysteine desulfhydrase-like pyridoxal-dependent ACC family enzyme
MDPFSCGPALDPAVRAQRARALGEVVGRVPYVKLACLPTPLHDMEVLTRALGGPRLMIKRDDLTGLALGGNKVRNWEYRLEELVREGAEVAILALDLQSNSARQSTAACTRAGIRTILVLEGSAPVTIQGNLLLDHVMGAEIHFAPTRQAQRAQIDALAAREREAGRRVAVVTDSPRFAFSSSVAYMRALLETMEQARAMGVRPTHYYICSAGKALGGMALAEALFEHEFRVHGVTATGEWNVPERTADIAREVAAELGLDITVSAGDVICHVDYVGQGYGIPSAASKAAVDRFARTEGILLDPVYTGKTAAALLAHVEERRFRDGDVVVFFHTGGTPAIFTHAGLWTA